ncbi:protein kinase [Aerosakkonemataceae cyanobacterium BLCC-F50]|uniref:non-specific serine/threonine protein kinase n=1 Tax=Floridaenema flaviceps BLCC-F50 TaxID=3153642 RepID=A0ABV4XWD7_9CYAN
MQTFLNNRYQIIRSLAAGGFGHTFLAEDTHLPSRRRCVIKQLKPIAQNAQVYQLIKQRFQREATILEKLGESHAQIPQLYAYFEENQEFYLVQEFIDGETLSEKIEKQGKLSDRTVQKILIDLLPVLDFIHSQGIIHRDIKPDNIILRQRDNKPVLIDFGALKETMTTTVNSQGNPTNSMVIGTPGFMSVEQAAGKPIYSSDLYSLGLTAIYLLTGKMPQELPIDPKTDELIWHQYAANINPNLAAVLDRSTKSLPGDRYSTARQMLDALQTSPTPVNPNNLSQQATVAVSPGRGSRQTVAVPSTASGWGIGVKVAIAAGILAASILGIVLAKSRTPAPEQAIKPESAPAPTRTPEPEPPEVFAPSPAPVPTRNPQPPVVFTPSPTPAPTRTVEPPVVFTPSPSPSPTFSPETVPTPEATETPSPTPTPTEPAPTSTPTQVQQEIPAFPVGTPISAVKQALGPETFDKRGQWNTRAVSYTDFLPGQVSLGYLYDPQSRVIRETEIAFNQSVDLQLIQKTTDDLLLGSGGEEVNRKLERVYQRQSRRQSFTSGSLKGEITRDEKDQIYIAIWDADLK